MKRQFFGRGNFGVRVVSHNRDVTLWFETEEERDAEHRQKTKDRGISNWKITKFKRRY